MPSASPQRGHQHDDDQYRYRLAGRPTPIAAGRVAEDGEEHGQNAQPVIQQKRSPVKPGQEVGRPVPTGVLFLKTMDRKGFGGSVRRTPGTPQPGRQRPLVKSPNPDQYGSEKPLGKVQGTDRIGVSWRQQETPDGIFHPLVDASRGNPAAVLAPVRRDNSVQRAERER